MPTKPEILSERDYALLKAVETGAEYGFAMLNVMPSGLFTKETVYIYLKRAEARQLLASRLATTPEGRGVRAYRLTSAGRKALMATRTYYATV